MYLKRKSIDNECEMNLSGLLLSIQPRYIEKFCLHAIQSNHTQVVQREIYQSAEYKITVL